MTTIYLDNNATTALDPRVAERMLALFQQGPCNASSLHRAGRQARAIIDDAVDQIGQCLDSRLDQPGGARLVFTSGGTESNNTALRGLTAGGPLIVSRIEHPSIVAPAESLAQSGHSVKWLDVDTEGIVDLTQLHALLNSSDQRPALVSVMSANNETGVIQPIDDVASLCRKAGVPLHVDATQTIGKLAFSCTDIGAAAVTFSAHKFHGPTGVGGLWLGPGVQIRPLLFGGEQQLESRPGTEPVPLIAGMAEALRLATDERNTSIGYCASLRDRLESGLLQRHPEIVVQASESPRLPGTCCISFIGADRQAMLMALDMAGIQCSSGSACSSGSSPPSHVLIAMNREASEIESTLRFSVSKFSTEEEIAAAIESISNVYSRLRR